MTSGDGVTEFLTVVPRLVSGAARCTSTPRCTSTTSTMLDNPSSISTTTVSAHVFVEDRLPGRVEPRRLQRQRRPLPQGPRADAVEEERRLPGTDHAGRGARVVKFRSALAKVQDRRLAASETLRHRSAAKRAIDSRRPLKADLVPLEDPERGRVDGVRVSQAFAAAGITPVPAEGAFRLTCDECDTEQRLPAMDVSEIDDVTV